MQGEQCSPAHRGEVFWLFLALKRAAVLVLQVEELHVFVIEQHRVLLPA